MKVTESLTGGVKGFFNLKNIVALVLAFVMIILLIKLFTRQKITMTDELGNVYLGEISNSFKMPIPKKSDDEDTDDFEN